MQNLSQQVPNKNFAGVYRCVLHQNGECWRWVSLCAREWEKTPLDGWVFDLSVTSFWPLYWLLRKYRRTFWAWKNNCLKKGDPEKLQRTLGTAESLAASLEASFCRCSALTLKTWVKKKRICLVMKESRGGNSDFQSFNRSETPRRSVAHGRKNLPKNNLAAYEHPRGSWPAKKSCHKYGGE